MVSYSNKTMDTGRERVTTIPYGSTPKANVGGRNAENDIVCSA